MPKITALAVAPINRPGEAEQDGPQSPGYRSGSNVAGSHRLRLVSYAWHEWITAGRATERSVDGSVHVNVEHRAVPCSIADASRAGQQATTRSCAT